MKSTDRLILLLLLLFCLITWWPTRFLPYHWDSAAFFVNATKYLLDHHFWPLIAPYSEFAHPPLLPLLTALSWTLFGHRLLVTHLVILPFYYLLLVSTYFLGKKIANWKVGTWSALLVGITPFILAEVGMPYLDLAAGALAVCALTFWLYRRYFIACLVLTAAVLIKSTVILLVIPLMITSLKHRPRLSLLSQPVIGTAIWLIYHHAVTGWWLTVPGRPTVLKLVPMSFLSSLKFVLYVFFIRQDRWLLTLGILIGLILIYRRSPKTFFKLRSHVNLLLLGIIAIFLGVFALTGEFIPRYSIAVLPLFYLMVTLVIFQALPSLWHHLVLAAVFLAFITTLRPDLPPTANFTFRIDEDLSYQDHIQNGLTLAKYLEQNFPQTPIYGGFPQSYQLTQPWQGYLTRPLNFHECIDYSLQAGGSALVYVHPYHYTQIDCQQLVATTGAKLVEQASSRGIWAQIYQINRP